MVAIVHALIFLCGSRALASECDLKTVASCEDQGETDMSALMQSRTNVMHEQDRTQVSRATQGQDAAVIDQSEGKFTHEATYFGHSYFVSADPQVGLKSTFDRIATGNMWGSKESVSGLGSELAMTAAVRKCLGQWIQKYNVTVFLDIPCGDANWQAQIPGLGSVKYRGYDIADKPVQRAKQKNSQTASMSFAMMDLTSEVPREKADIIMLRDVIQHLPLQKGKQMLVNAKKSGARYLAVSSFTDGMNKEVPAGGFYKNNVHAQPFGLPGHVETCQNYEQSLPQSVLPTSHLELIELSAWVPSP